MAALLLSCPRVASVPGFPLAPPPKTERPASPPKTERPASPSKTERTASPPKTERTASPPKTERPASPPKTERPTQQPKTERLEKQMEPSMVNLATNLHKGIHEPKETEGAEALSWAVDKKLIWERSHDEKTVIGLSPPKAQVVPSILYIMPTCPRVSRVPGLPTIDQTKAVDWPVDSKSLFKTSPTEVELLMVHLEDVDTVYHDSEKNKEIVALAPSCQREASIPGVPSAPRQEHTK
ncbi:unnamed protein product [Coregonus sp. 'balchen']|nr:unnamed protein product [Coregonus sp. 'balchen']